MVLMGNQMAISQNILFASFLVVAFGIIAINIVVPLPAAVQIFLLVIALAADVVAFSTRYYAYMFGPFFKMKNGKVTLNDSEAFTLSPSGNAIIVREGEGVWATSYIRVPVYKSGTEMSPEEKVDFSSLFSRVVTLSKDPFRIATQLSVINKDDYLNRIRDKMNAAEERYQRIVGDQAAKKPAVERVKGEVTMWHNLFDNVTKAQSNALSTYVMVSAYGGSEDEAVNIVLRKADELASGIGAIFGVAPTMVQGTDMLAFVEPEYIIPVGTVSEQIRQKTVGSGI